MPSRTITIDVRDLEMIVEVLEQRARSASRNGAVESAHLMDADLVRDLLRRHDASREPVEPTNGDD